MTNHAIIMGGGRRAVPAIFAEFKAAGLMAGVWDYVKTRDTPAAAGQVAALKVNGMMTMHAGNRG